MRRTGSPGRWARRAGLAAAGLAATISAAAQPAPAGWQELPAGGGEGRRVFAPPGDEATATQAEWQRRSLPPGTAPGPWLLALAQADTPPLQGRWLRAAELASSHAQAAMTLRAFRSASGRDGLVMLALFARPGQGAHTVRWWVDGEASGRRHGPAVKQWMAELEGAAAGGAAASGPSASPPAPPSTAVNTAPPPAAARAPAGTAAATTSAGGYPHTTAPGQGLQPQDLETVYYGWDQPYTYVGMQFISHVYLLLKDGSAYQGLPVPPQDMDVAASRAAEPKRWGRWRLQNGRYEFSWPERPDRFSAPQQGGPESPGRPGLTLQGRWTATHDYNLPGGSSSTWRTWTLVMGHDGRFETDQAGGAAVGSGSTQSHTRYDRRGSSGTSATATAVMGQGTRHADTGANSGRYQIDGYGITLHFDNGQVQRQPFFYDARTEGSLWFQGGLLMRDKKPAGTRP